MTGSSRWTWRNVVSPRMRSWTTVSPSSGTRRRTAPSASASPRKPRSAPCSAFHARTSSPVALERYARPSSSRRASTSSGRAGGRAWGGGALGVAVGAADLRDRALVVVELEPPQRLEDLLDVLGGRALAVGIFDAQDEGPAGVPREEPVVERGPRAADVQRAGRRGSEANPHALGQYPAPPEALGREARVLIGAHVSPAGGPANAIQRGREKGCRAIQFFKQSPRAWRPTIYTDEQVAAYLEAKRGSGVDALLIHAVYLLNAATTDREMRRKTRDALIVALQAGDKLGARGVVLHAGSAKTGSVKPAIARAGKVIREALSESDGCPLHLENTGGAGATLGRSFHELAALIDAAGGDERLGVCLDSCHLFASGFEIRTPEALGAVLDECVELVGSGRVGSLHLNDSQTPLGSNRDRHP